MSTDWQAVQRRRYERGDIDESGTGRRVRASTCSKCYAPILKALDADVLAFSVSVDPAPIGVESEAAALLSGRSTYRLRWAGQRYELDRRDQFAITATSPLDVEVLAEHRCDALLPTRRAAPSKPQSAPRARVDPNRPPY